METMKTVNQGYECLRKLSGVMTRRVAHASRGLLPFMRRKQTWPISNKQTEQQDARTLQRGDCPEGKNRSHKKPNLEVLEHMSGAFLKIRTVGEEERRVRGRDGAGGRGVKRSEGAEKGSDGAEGTGRGLGERGRTRACGVKW
ncbi:hypothetical protein Tco_0891059 [Tanacetum coccineum]|uniref:Uncharacterized protein n=1 Tax=Tanacetum coccineum TaxID=301880 RepID=A0ABQ5C4U3_9ASTR